jgi:putative ABC transport system permease protein
MARRFWPDESPLGKLINVLGTKREIIGVAEDVKYTAIDAETAPEMYVQSSLWSMSLLVRTDSDPLDLVVAIQREVKSIDQDQPISGVKTLEQRVADSVSAKRFSMMLMLIFAVVALLLAVVGIYGVMSYSVTQSTREIGIRMALGATRKDVLGLIIRNGVALTTIGLVLGLAMAFGITRFMRSMLYGVSATDAVTFTVVALALAVVAIGACYLPARRATKVDAIIVLRSE